MFVGFHVPNEVLHVLLYVLLFFAGAAVAAVVVFYLVVHLMLDWFLSIFSGGRR